MELAIFGITSVFGIIVWGLRLEGKQMTAEVHHNDLKELINTRFDSIDQRLDRVERSMNGFLHAKE